MSEPNQPELIKMKSTKGGGKSGPLLKSISDLVKEAKATNTEAPRALIFRKNPDGSQKQTQEIQD